MIKSALIHVVLALAFQLIIGLLTGNWWAGAAIGIGWFWSREHAQRQYKLSAGVSIKRMDPWEGMDVINWSRDALLDAILPTIAVLIVAVVMG
jgi:hypothetical protein